MAKILSNNTDGIHPIKSSWAYDFETIYLTKPKIDISKLTLDEQADLIVEKLKTAPKPILFNEYDAMTKLTLSIAREIDNEILKIAKYKNDCLHRTW